MINRLRHSKLRLSLTLQITPSQSKMKTSTLSIKFSAGSVSFITFAILTAVVLWYPLAFSGVTNAGLERNTALLDVENPATREEDVAKQDANRLLEYLIVSVQWSGRIMYGSRWLSERNTDIIFNSSVVCCVLCVVSLLFML